MRFALRFPPAQLIDFQLLLEEYTERAENMSPPLRVCVQMFIDSQKAQFASKQGWAPLTPGTLAAKERRGFPEMMVKSGLLKAALTHRKGTKYSSNWNTKTMAVFGTSDPGARLQALGTKERYQKNGLSTGRITPRPLSFVQDTMVLQFYDILESYLVTGDVAAAKSAQVFSAMGL